MAELLGCRYGHASCDCHGESRMNAASNMRVLIAEDDFASRILLQAILEKWGYEVVVADDGAAAWRILDADNAPPIAVLDWMMPHLSGIDLCARIRGREQDLAPYVVMLTAKGEKSDVTAGLDAGADDYLVKPFDFAELGARLRVAKRAIALQRDLIESRKAVRYQSLHDVSTGALNRGAILNQLSELLGANASATIGLLAIDEHKRILRDDGTESAEAAVRALVHAVRARFPSALIGRYCSDQLLCIWRDVEIETVYLHVEAMRSADESAASSPATGNHEPASFSCGLTTSADSTSTELLLCYADSALYSARALAGATEIFTLELVRQSEKPQC